MNAGLLDNPQQKLISVDKSGKEISGTIDRGFAHTTPGIKHLAIQVLVFNSKKELVLHERPLKKVGGGVLDAPTTHVLFGETKEQAAMRCLRNEYGIAEKLKVKILGGYSYEKDYGDGSCENEFCIAAFSVFDGNITPSKEHAGKIINVPAKEVLKEINSAQKKYPVWFKETIKIVSEDALGKKFF